MQHLMCPECRTLDTLEYIVRTEYVHQLRPYTAKQLAIGQTIEKRSSGVTDVTVCTSCGWSIQGTPVPSRVTVERAD